jgi:polyhydroxybutyrate depolymerase
MALKKYCVIALVVILVMMLPVTNSAPAAAETSPGAPDLSPGLHTGWIMETSTVNSTWVFNRTFEYYIPTSYSNAAAVTLLFSFHGLGSSGLEQIDLTRFDVLAEQEGFIAVFPDATRLDPADPRWQDCLAAHGNWTLPALTGSNIMWNVGEIEGIAVAPLQECAGVDDVGFVVDMIDWFEANYAIDASRIYSTGMSNGAMFSYFLAFYVPDVFAAIAPVCAPMPLNLGVNATTTPAPITVIVVRGSSDPVIPEPGECGLICDDFSFSTNETIAYWCGVDGITAEPVETVWGPTSEDATIVHRYVYSGGMNGTQVILFMVDGGGHTWPGGPLYSVWVGAITTHIDGSALVWKYLPPEKYYLEISSANGGSVATPGRETFANVNSAGAYMFFNPGTGDTVVDLVATPDSHHRFANWTGDVSTIADVNSATTSIAITPNTDYEITAVFEEIPLVQYNLSISATGGGSVTEPGEGVFPYEEGTAVDLVATPQAGYRFLQWTGDVTKIDDPYAAETTITMEGNYVITANFEATPSGGLCFIATAAYGTSTARQLDVLREFRDDVLLESGVGSHLVDLYYHVSPPIAEFISEHSLVRTMVRGLVIDPIVWVIETTGDIWRN